MALIGGAPVRERVRWQGVLEALDEVVLLLNAHDVVTYASPSVRVRLGYAPEAITGQALGDLVHPDDLRAALRNLAEVGLGAPVRHAMRVRGADDRYVPLDWSLTRAVDPVDRAEVVVLSGRDGTSRVMLEERLASVDQRHRTLLATLSEAVVFLDAQLRVEEVNDAAAALLGIGARDLLGRHWFEALDIWDENGRRLTRDADVVAALLTQPAPQDVRQDVRQDVWRSILRGDGQRVLVRCRWTPLSGGSTGSPGHVLIMQDAVNSRAGTSPAPLQQRRRARTVAGLTPREHEVLERLADGRDAKEIAREFDLSVYSVRGHIKSLMRKLGVHSQLQAVVAAARRGMVDVVGGRSPASAVTGADTAGRDGSR
ncbi:MAG TPA: PAS domain-containing protein [Kineosporiaceae bacterium]|nr:PAS domain-containing protein [Kineosporiaceae bacterium]